MRNRYAAGALALSAGLSVYTLSSLPKGGVARSWVTTEARGSFPMPAWLRPFSSPAPFAAPVSRAISAAAAVSAALAPRPAVKPVFSAVPVGPGAGSFFDRKPLPRHARAVEPQRRPDMGSLIVTGTGDYRVVDYAEGGVAVGPAAATGSLEGFRWQEGPRVRDDLPGSR